MKRLIYLLPLMLVGCATSLPPLSDASTTAIETWEGPEDFDVDSVVAAYPRLLISCDPRREGKGEEQIQAKIQSLNLLTDEVVDMPRVGEPDSINFHPHGLDVVCDGEDCVLYVISHDAEADKHYIIRYRIEVDQLVFEEVFADPLLTSPNAVAGLPNGDIYVSNDAEKHGNRVEMMLKQKKAKVVYWDGESWTVAAEKLAMGNGIVLRDGYAYVATTRQKALFKYEVKDGKFVNRENIMPVLGLDNLRFDGDDLLVAVHPDGIAFVKHAKNSEKHSPSVVYRVKTDGSSYEPIYVDDGTEISANATAIRYGKYLYISQVFDPFVLKVEVE